MKISRYIFPILILAISFSILLPVSPIYRQIPAVDSSVFMYIGQRVLEGGVPYRDGWDHKQPLLYLAYAAAQGLPFGAMWGSWLLLVFVVGAAGWLAYAVVRRFAGENLAFLSVLCGLLGLYPILWGGSIEELSMPCQLLAIYALIRYQATKSTGSRWFFSTLIGVSIGLAFFLKQNLIAAGAVVCVYLVLDLILGKKWKDWFVFIGILAGFLLVAGPLLVYLRLGDALQQYWEAAFVFNSRYAGLGPLEQFHAILDALEYMSGIPGLLLSTITWLGCLGMLFLHYAKKLSHLASSAIARRLGLLFGSGMTLLSLVFELVGSNPGFGLAQTLLLATGILLSAACLLLSLKQQRERVVGWLRDVTVPISSPHLLWILALYYPMILFLLTLSGRNYVYYFITFIPYLMIALGGLGSAVISSVTGSARRVAWLAMLMVWLGTAILPVIQLSSAFQEPANRPAPEIVDYILENTTPDETILAWGKSSTYVYPVTGRKAPSRHFYQASLYEEGYNHEFGIADEILDDIQSNPPRLFLFHYEQKIDVQAGQCPLGVSGQPNSEGQILGFICDHYTYQGQVGGFLVFRLQKP